jgi:hypothetical protein
VVVGWPHGPCARTLLVDAWINSILDYVHATQPAMVTSQEVLTMLKSTPRAATLVSLRLYKGPVHRRLVVT